MECRMAKPISVELPDCIIERAAVYLPVAYERTLQSLNFVSNVRSLEMECNMLLSVDFDASSRRCKPPFYAG